MVISDIYNAIRRGKWFICESELLAQQTLVDALLTHKPIEGEEKEALSRTFAKSKDKESGNTFDDAPEGSIAIIPLEGTMMKYDTRCSYGTASIAGLLREAVNSDKIDGILLDIDSGGGAVDAIAPLLDAIDYAHAKLKPVVAFCDLCASAAYYVAAACDAIMAGNSISSEFGSIGVMMSFMDYSKYYADLGIKEHTIYSSLSDYKNAPFEAARKGEYDLIRAEELDPLALGFQQHVKSHRAGLKTDEKGILNGRMFYAQRAVEVGLADSIGDLGAALALARQLREKMCVQEYINQK